MAILQISKIQQRRGLQQDLPQLASGEFGWSLDQRRLFIGNGTENEGAPIEGVTEILTQYSDFVALLKNYTYRGEAGGYVAQTGATLANPTVRTFQGKLDDFVSVKDFGATGRGDQIDPLTGTYYNDLPAINRAIQQTYAASRTQLYPSTRRTIYFPAGIYNISGGKILVPPWLRIIGDGINSTIINQIDNTQDSVLQFCDSNFNVEAAIAATPGSKLPTSINIENLTLQTTAVIDVVIIDNATGVNFRLVEFKGPVGAASAASAYAGVKFKSFDPSVPTANITFDYCSFKQLSHAMISNAATNGVKINGCVVDDVYKGLVLGAASTLVTDLQTNFRITNTAFNNVVDVAIDCYNSSTNIGSISNQFTNVGRINSTPCISYVTDGNYSIADVFDREINTVATADTKTALLLANVGLQLGTATIGTGSAVVLSGNTTASSTTNIIVPAACTINYSMSDNNAYRVGTIVHVNGQYTDNYSASNTTLPVSITINSNTIRFTNTGNDTSFRYNINYF